MRLDGQSGGHIDNPVGATLMGVRGGLSVFTQSEVSFIHPQLKRRPGRLIRSRNRLGRREIEPESFVSSSCVGDRL